MKFIKYITTFTAIVLMLSHSLMHSMDKPYYRQALDYASRYKKEIGAGVGAAAALGGLYYGYQQGWFSGRQSGINIINSHNWRFEHQEDKEFPVGNKSLVEIVNTAGDIDVQTYAGNTIKVHIHKRAETQADLDNIYADIHENDQRLLITTRQRVQLVKALINYKLLLPQDKKIALIAKTNAGDISVEGIKKDVNVETASGDITVRNINGNVRSFTAAGTIVNDEVKGSITAKTLSGELQITRIGGDATIESANGKAKVSSVNGTFVVSLNQGDVIASHVKNTRAKTNAGNIYVSSNQGTFTASTNAGNVQLDQNVIDQAVDMSSNAGSVIVDARTIAGPIYATTMVGSVRSAFGDNRNAQGPAVKLKTFAGDITINRK